MSCSRAGWVWCAQELAQGFERAGIELARWELRDMMKAADKVAEAGGTRGRVHQGQGAEAGGTVGHAAGRGQGADVA